MLFAGLVTARTVSTRLFNNPADAILEADFCKRIIHAVDVFLELPVFFDMEDADDYKARRNFNFSKRNVTAICRAFLDTIKPLDCGVYASYSWLQDILIGGA